MPSHNPSYRSLLPSPSHLPTAAPSLYLLSLRFLPGHRMGLTSQVRDRAFDCTVFWWESQSSPFIWGQQAAWLRTSLNGNALFILWIQPAARALWVPAWKQRVPCPAAASQSPAGPPCPRRDWSCNGRKSPRGRVRPETPTVQGSHEASNESTFSTLCRREAHLGWRGGGRESLVKGSSHSSCGLRASRPHGCPSPNLRGCPACSHRTDSRMGAVKLKNFEGWKTVELKVLNCGVTGVSLVCVITGHLVKKDFKVY